MKEIDAFQKGMSFYRKRCFTDNDVREFARISGDNNPVHFDDNAASFFNGK